MMVVLKIPIVYLYFVVRWAIRAEPEPGAGGASGETGWQSGPPGWWRRAPFTPRPDRAYLRFRTETAYGPGARPGPDVPAVRRRLQQRDGHQLGQPCATCAIAFSWHEPLSLPVAGTLSAD